MSIEESALKIVRREGGYVDHPADRGGPTKHGVTLTAYRHYWNAEGTLVDLQALTADEAAQLLIKGYYLELFEEFPPWLVDQLFDISVNMGGHAVIALWQRALNRLGPGTLAVDGCFGPKTQAASRQALMLWSKVTGDALVDERILAYCRLAVGDQTQLPFLIGWITRALEFKTYANAV